MHREGEKRAKFKNPATWGMFGYGQIASNLVIYDCVFDSRYKR